MVRALATALCGVFLSGCMLITPIQGPVAKLNGQAPRPDPTPNVLINFKHRHTMDGRENCLGCGVGQSLTNSTALQSLNRVKSDFPYLEKVILEEQRDRIKPDYILDLDTEIAEMGQAEAFICGLTLFLIPGFGETSFIVDATFTTPDGKAIISKHISKRRAEITQQIFLIFYAPFKNATINWNAFYDDVYRDALNQISNDFKDYLEKNAPAVGSAPATQPPAQPAAPATQ